MSFELRAAFGPSFQVTSSASRPCLRRPHVIADDGNEVIEHNHLPHARNGLGRLVVDLADLAAEHRTLRQGRELHAGKHRVDAIHDFAVGLVRRIEALQRLADQREIPGVFERDVGWAASRGSQPRPGLHRKGGGRWSRGSPAHSTRCSSTARPATAGQPPAAAWRARRHRLCAMASRRREPTSSRRWPECAREDWHKAFRWAAHAAAPPGHSRASSSSAKIIATAV